MIHVEAPTTSTTTVLVQCSTSRGGDSFWGRLQIGTLPADWPIGQNNRERNTGARVSPSRLQRSGLPLFSARNATRQRSTWLTSALARRRVHLQNGAARRPARLAVRVGRWRVQGRWGGARTVCMAPVSALAPGPSTRAGGPRSSRRRSHVPGSSGPWAVGRPE